MKSVIIDRLIQIEESAQRITGGLEAKESELPVLVNEKCTEIENSFKSEYEKKVAETESTKRRECERKLGEIDKDYIERGKKLDQLFKENHEKWENELLNRIIGR